MMRIVGVIIGESHDAVIEIFQPDRAELNYRFDLHESLERSIVTSRPKFVIRAELGRARRAISASVRNFSIRACTLASAISRDPRRRSGGAAEQLRALSAAAGRARPAAARGRGDAVDCVAFDRRAVGGCGARVARPRLTVSLPAARRARQSVWWREPPSRDSMSRMPSSPRRSAGSSTRAIGSWSCPTARHGAGVQPCSALCRISIRIRALASGSRRIPPRPIARCNSIFPSGPSSTTPTASCGYSSTLRPMRIWWSPSRDGSLISPTTSAARFACSSPPARSPPTGSRMAAGDHSAW